MAISFGPLPTTHGTSEGATSLTMRAAGVDALITAGLSFGGGRMTMRAHGLDDAGAGEVVITIPDYGVMGMTLRAASHDASHTGDTGGVAGYLTLQGYDLITQQDAGAGEFSMRLRATEYVAPTAYGYFVEQPGQMTGYGGAAYERFVSEMAFGDASHIDPILLLRSVFALTDEHAWINDLVMELTSSLQLSEAFHLVFEAAFTSTIDLNDSSTMALDALVALSDLLVLQGEVGAASDALVALVSALVLGDTFAVGQDINVESVLELADQLSEEIAAVMALVSDLNIEAELSGAASMTIFVSSELALDDAQGMTLDALMALLDTVGFAVRFTVPGSEGGQFVGYAMNLRNAGVTTYENYPFNGMATVGGVALAIGEEGLYRLDGDTDAGAPINARVRTGLMDFNTSMLKRVLNSYVGYTTDGRLVMKVTTTDGGRKIERWFGLNPRAADSPVDGRFDIAKGIVGLYYGFELANLDGADFELDTIKLWPFVVQRRKSGR